MTNSSKKQKQIGVNINPDLDNPKAICMWCSEITKITGTPIYRKHILTKNKHFCLKCGIDLNIFCGILT